MSHRRVRIIGNALRARRRRVGADRGGLAGKAKTADSGPPLAAHGGTDEVASALTKANQVQHKLS